MTKDELMKLGLDEETASTVEMVLTNALAEKEQACAAEIKTLKINTAVDAALSAANAKNHKAVRALLDLTNAELSADGEVIGLAEQIRQLQRAEDAKFLFETPQTKADGAKKIRIKGAYPAEAGAEEPDLKVDKSKMTYEELAAYMDAGRS